MGNLSYVSPFTSCYFLFIFTKLSERKDGSLLKKTGADLGLLIFAFVAFLSLFSQFIFMRLLSVIFKILVNLSLLYIVLNTVESENAVGSKNHFEFILNAVLALALLLSLLGFLAYLGNTLHLNSPFFTFLLQSGLLQGNAISSTLQYSNTFACLLYSCPFFISFSLFHRKKGAFKKNHLFYLVSIFPSGACAYPIKGCSGCICNSAHSLCISSKRKR